MSSFFDEASLVMIPSGYKDQKVYSVKPLDGSGDLTFSRASNATRVASNGLIEKVRTNLVTYSEDWTNAAWTKTNATVTANATTNPIDGASTADAVFETSATGQHNFFQAYTTTSGAEVTISFYAKANGRTKMRMNNGSSAITAAFDLTAVTASMLAGTGTPTITSVGSGWFRCSLRYTAASTEYVAMNFRDDLDQDSYAGDITKGMYFFGAQAETGVLTDYIATTSAAVSVGPVSGLPRLDYLGSTCPRLLLEPQRSSLVTFSEQIDNAAWSKLFLGVTANNATSPDGFTNADKLIPDATLNTHLFFQSLSPAAGVYTQSAFFKAGEYNFACLRLSTDSDTKRFAVVLNLTTGAITATDSLGSPTSTSSKVENYGNGWYRLSISSAHTSGTIFPTFAVSSTAVPTFSNSLPLFTGNGTSGIFAYGCQVEAGAYATSYIPTLGASVTRVADAASKTGITSLIGQTEGTLFINYTCENSTASVFSRAIAISDGTGDNRIIFNDNVGVMSFFASKAGATQANAATAVSFFGTHKVAIAYANNDFKVYVDGVAVVTDTNFDVPACSNLYVATYEEGTSNASNNKINQALLFKTRLTNAALAELTSL
jgi:hypothetical protein